MAAPSMPRFCRIRLGVLVLVSALASPSTARVSVESTGTVNADTSVLQENTLRVQELNEITQLEGPAAVRFGVDGPFGGLAQDEFRRRVLMPPRAPVNHPSRRYRRLENASNATLLPSSFDWRTKGAVTPVKNQGYLGTCWAFSTVENLEGQLYLQSGNLTPLSVEQLVECDGLADPSRGYADCGEFGGWPYLAYEYLRTVGGIFTDNEFPYCSGIPYGDPGNCMPCMPPGYSTKFCGNHSDLYCKPGTTKGQRNGGLCSKRGGFAADVADWQAISPDEAEIKRHLVEVGPLSAALNAALLQFYYGGVYNPYDFLCDPDSLDHAVLLVGYGTEDGVEYWIVKNSWGPEWGEDGYFRIARGTGKCGINTAVTTGLLRKSSGRVDEHGTPGGADGGEPPFGAHRHHLQPPNGETAYEEAVL